MPVFQASFGREWHPIGNEGQDSTSHPERNPIDPFAKLGALLFHFIRLSWEDFRYSQEGLWEQ